MYKIDMVEGNLVIVIADVASAIAKATPSKSGKSKVVATTGGFTSVTIPKIGTVKVGLNVIA